VAGNCCPVVLAQKLIRDTTIAIKAIARRRSNAVCALLLIIAMTPFGALAFIFTQVDTGADNLVLQ
jgi:hypothetical protein